MRTWAFVLALAACGPESFTVGRPPPKQPPAGAVGGFAIQLPPMTLQPGEERFPCWLFPLDLMGPSHIVGGATLIPSPGMHHGNVVTRRKTGDGIRQCPADVAAGGSEAIDVLNGGAVLFASSTQISTQEWLSFPPRMGYRVQDGYEIIARMHYLNASTQAVTVQPSYQWYTIDESTLVEELGPFIWVYSNFMIPPQTTYTARGDCTFPKNDHPMHVVELLPHMHKLGIEFDAGVTGGPLDGKNFLTSPGYDPDRGVLTLYDPAIDLTAPDGVTFSCTWNNTTDQTIYEGTGTNEMCMLFGYAYPAAAAWSALANDGGCLMSNR